ncbi:vomeronasal type-1 receptor 1-like [Gracilinanus agilis]|uniref:vomeronasal type-1 receptor 1-like n=1 Tax=Gracilinanus agilis TaxID=191870 RepID=UPI001CFDDB9E|nr:vomeronasal type-1 receptor 1-like [Gracilinanus agilis]
MSSDFAASITPDTDMPPHQCAHISAVLSPVLATENSVVTLDLTAKASKITQEMGHKEDLSIFYLSVLLFGVLGNIFLLYLHSLKLITGHRKRLLSLIIINLAISHILMILFRGISTILSNWGWRAFLDLTMGNILNYFIRVTRGLSLCSTCLLSVFQAITISPSSLKWAEIKTRAQKCILPCCLLSWIFNLLFDIAVPLIVSNPRNSSNERWRIGHVSFDLHAMSIKILTFESFVDALFMGLMIFSSGYMMIVLYKHNQRIQHIHSISFSHKASPETRATKAILMLVITFVCFNSASSPFVIYTASSRITRHWGLRLTVALSMFFPIISPFMLINIDTQMSRLFHTLLGFQSSCQERLPS